MLKNNLDYVLKKEVSRKEFLMSIGLIIFSLTGISGILKLVSQSTPGAHRQIASSPGFGSGPYGGKRKEGTS